MTQAVFFRIMQMQKTIIPVILVVLVMRLVLKHAPKKWSLALWSVVGFRLLCPISFQAAFSLFTFRQYAEAVPQPGGPYVTAGPSAVYPATEIPFIPFSHSTQIVMPAPSPDPMTIFLTVGTSVWILGMSLILVYSIISYVKLNRQMTTAIRLRENIWQSDRICSPFILGYFRPRIFIPYGLDETALQAVLAHEHCHLKHRDHWIKPAAYLLLTVHWFNPLVWLSFRCMSKDMEMRTDEEVLASGIGNSRIYSTTLLSFAANRRFPVPSPLAFGESDVKSRIKNALRWKRPRLWITVVSIFLCAAVIAACAADPKDKSTDVTCTVTVNETSIPAQYYKDGFDYNYDKLMSLTPTGAEHYTLTFDVSWNTEHLTVGEGYYSKDGDIRQVTHTLQKNNTGHFSLDIPAPQGDMEYAVYSVFAENGVFVIKVYFQAYRPWNVQITATDITRTGATIQFQHYTVKDGMPETGERFWLERMDGSNWVPVDAEADRKAFGNMLAYRIGAEPLTLECDWTNLYGSLPDGVYRLGKEVSDGDETMNCYVLFSFPTHLQAEPTCEVSVSGLDDAPAVRWFPEGFDFEYDKLTTIPLPYQDNYELVFRPSWNCEVLKVGQDFYTRNGSAATCYCDSYDLSREADGAFHFHVSRMNADEAEHAVYYIPYLKGKFVFRLEFAPREAEFAYSVDPLEQAIHDAILEYNKGPKSTAYFPCESHVTLAHITSDGLADNDTDWRGQDILYIMALYQEYEISTSGIIDQGGSHMPIRLTFDRYANGTYQLAEYWIPEDGTNYSESIRSVFPEFVWEDALDTQKFILPQIQNCYAQAVASAEFDPAPVIEALFDEIASSPTQNSNPGNYSDSHTLSIRELTYYGDYTLEYIFRRFIAGGQTGPEGDLMYHVLKLLIGKEIVLGSTDSAQAQFDLWKNNIQTERNNYGDEWLQKNRPKGWLLTQLLDNPS